MSSIANAKAGGFIGKPEQLERFLRLAATPIRCRERGDALLAWSEYKLAAGQAFIDAKRPVGPARKAAKKSRANRPQLAPAIDLRGALIRGLCLGYVDLRGAHLRGVRLVEADLRYADLSGADLTDADLTAANLSGANLSGATLVGANLERASLMGADLRGTNMRGARVYGVAAWNVQLCRREALRKDLIVTPHFNSPVRVNNLDVAQFVYVLLTGARLGPAFDALSQKGVLILGRFTPQRKAVLDVLRDALRERDFVPLIFDFDRPRGRDLTETVQLLAGISRFIIADITNPRSSPLELHATVPQHMVPMVPIIQAGEAPFPMFKDLWIKHNQWVLDPLEYRNADELLHALWSAIIEPALTVSATLTRAKAKPLRTRRAADYIAATPESSAA
jgi:hypothetical protein